MITSEDHRGLIETLIAKHTLGKVVLEFPEDLCERSRQLGHEDNNPFRMAKSIGLQDGRRYILIAQAIGDDQIQSAKDRMILNGLGPQVASLKSDHDFLKHLVLHEVATFVLSAADQEARDRWAFEQMGSAG